MEDLVKQQQENKENLKVYSADPNMKTLVPQLEKANKNAGFLINFYKEKRGDYERLLATLSPEEKKSLPIMIR